jgi:mRNA interferase RelE/StbE
VTRWQLQVAPAAERLLARLPERVATAIVEFIVGPLRDAPEQLGKPLQRELDGYRAARRGAYRIIYRLDHVNDVIRIVRIEHRADVFRRT